MSQTIEELKAKERELSAKCDEVKKLHDAAIDEWHKVYHAIREQEQREVIRAELLKEMEAVKV